MPAKKAPKPEYAQLSLKIDKALNDELEDFWRKNHYQDKSSCVREAVDYFIHASFCERCGSLIDQKAFACSVCGKLVDSEETRHLDEVLKEALYKLGVVADFICSKEEY